MRKLRRFLLVLTVALATLSFPTAASCYRRVKIGPFELVPSLGVDLRHHSNVYLASDSDPGKKISGLLLDIRPGLSLQFRPKLERHIRGLYLDLKYNPSIALFPNAKLCLLCQSIPQLSVYPDKFKLDHNLSAQARYQYSGRLTFSTTGAYTQPELSFADISLEDINYGAGVKYDIARRVSLEGSYNRNRFRTPVQRFTSNTEVVEDSILGSFHENTITGRLSFQRGQSLTFSTLYEHRERTFLARPLNPENDINGDGIFDNSKDYTQQSVTASIAKLITRQTRGTISGGYVWRDQAERNFGAGDYSRFVGSATVETLLTKRTRLQASAEYTLADTFRRLSFEDINAFTNDQIGQFSVLPEEFSTAVSRRLVVDLVQNVFQRGDQLIFGVALQRNQLLDQLGGGNFFEAPLGKPNDLRLRTGSLVCAVPGSDPANPSVGARFCTTILPDQEQQMVLLSLGYRMRILRWLGIQAKGAFFDGETTPVLKTEKDPADLNREREAAPIHTSYWNLSAGIVVNLQVFQ